MSDRTQYLGRNNLSLIKKLKYKFVMTRVHAGHRGISWDLSFEDYVQLWKAQRGKSAYSGLRMLLSTNGRGLITRNKWGVSLDRLDNSVGYTKENCVFVRFCENCRKQQMNFFTSEFMDLYPDWTAQVLALRPELNQISSIAA